MILAPTQHRQRCYAIVINANLDGTYQGLGKLAEGYIPKEAFDGAKTREHRGC